MAIDTPARLAILGAGPIGLEAALYARFLGYEVHIFERGQVGENILRWGHVRMFSPFGMNRSPLALAALAAQDEQYQPPADDQLLTGREYVERFLQPLANTDLLIDGLALQTDVVAVGKPGLLKGDAIGDPVRQERPFCLLVRSAEGERLVEADGVIDTTGTLGTPCHLGPGGIPAVGESECHERIDYRWPDILGQQRELYAGRHTLVVGCGYSAATNVVLLAELAQSVPGTRITWITRNPAGEEGPLPEIDEDPLVERARLTQQANQLARTPDSPVQHLGPAWIQRLQRTPDGQLLVNLADNPEPLQVDRVLANVGFRPDTTISQQLQVHYCYATDSPMQLASQLLNVPPADCLQQTATGPQSLITSEPNFYILGSKSYGRQSPFLISVGLHQIRELFSIIADREDLNLYTNVQHLLP